MSSCLDAEQMGASIPHNSMLIDWLVGTACEQIGNRPAGDLVDHLNAAEARSAARRLAAIDRSQVSAADALQYEKWFYQGAFIELFQKPDAYKVLGWSDDPKTSAALTFAMSWESYDNAMESYTTYMDRVVAGSRLPYQKFAHSPEIPAPTDPYCIDLEASYQMLRVRGAEYDCDNRLFEVELALRAYYVDHGRYPTALSALVPAYIPSVPADPYADAGPLRYRLTAKRYVLYSVGPDGVDDGGKPIVNVDETGSKRYFVYKGDERGDFVAGVNR
jgi:hypothetical protein